MIVQPQSLTDSVAELSALGVTSIRSFAWRDLDDPDAGGSEVHADEILRRWAAAGLQVRHRTSAADGARTVERNGYVIEQRGSRYSVFPSVLASEIRRRTDPATATLEIWNGVPWFSRWWAGPRRVVWLHHVHEEMWRDVLPRPLDVVGRVVETRIAPRWYRHQPVVTLSDTSRYEIERIGIPSSQIRVIPPGVSPRFTHDEARRSPTPHVVAVGRLAPVKRMQEVLAAVAVARESVPDLTVEIVGEGAMRAGLEEWIALHGAQSWATLVGRIDDEALVAAYQRAWLVVSASSAEGWGMSMTEGATCGTPAVATDISGHRDSVVDGATGDLVANVSDLGPALAALLLDTDRRRRYAAAAISHAAAFSWDGVAAQQLEVLVGECRAAARSRR